MKVLHIDIDTLRPDHLSCYGYQRNTSPNIDSIAKNGIKFTNCFSSDSPCMPSRAATFSGTYGIKNGIITHGERGLKMKGKMETLPLVLRKNGVHTYAFGSFGRHPAPWYYVGFEELHDPLVIGESNFQEMDGTVTTEKVLKVLNNSSTEKDMYLHIHFWDPHTPYAAPLSFLNLIENEYFPDHPTENELNSQMDKVYWHSPKTMGITTYDDWKRLINEYDAEIRYADFNVGQILRKIEELDDDFLIIVMSDHGEEFGEHGPISEHWSVYNGTQRVPLILYSNKLNYHGDYCGLVYQFDIAATILDAFKISVPKGWDSKSVLDFINQTVPERQSLIVGHGLYTYQRAVITKDFKLIKTYNPGMWHLPELQLYSMKDTWESVDLSGSDPERVKILISVLTEWEDTNANGEDPMVSTSDNIPAGISMYAKALVEAYVKKGELISWKSNKRKLERNIDS